MPIITTATAEARVQQFGSDPLKEVVQGEYRFRANDVKVIDKAIDLTDVPEGSKIELHLPETQNKTVHVFVSAKTQVNVVSDSWSRVRVVDTTGKTFSGRNHVYASNATRAMNNINGSVEFPNTDDCETLEFGPYSSKDPEAHDHLIYCRHMATAQILMRKGLVKAPNGATDWKSMRNYFHENEENFQALFESQKIWESMSRDAIVGAGERFTFGINDMHKFFVTELTDLQGHLETTGENQENHYIMNAETGIQGDVGHALYVSLQVKKDDGELKFKIKTYDPNLSDIHMSYTTNELKNVFNTDSSEFFVELDANLDHITMYKMEPQFPMVANTSVEGFIYQYHLRRDVTGKQQFIITSSFDKDMLPLVEGLTVARDETKQYTACGVEVVLPKDVK